MTSTVLTDTGRDYLDRHAIDPLVLAQVGVVERDGRLILPNGRSTALNGAGEKVKQPWGVPLALWWPTGPPEHDGATVLVTEGESDALAALSTVCWSEIEHQGAQGDPLAGVTVAAMPGSSYPARRLADDLRGAGVVILAFDGDDAGRKATAAAAAALDRADILVHEFEIPDGHDLADCLAELPPNLRAPWLAGQIDDARPIEGVVATPEPREILATTPVDRYAGRRVDLDALLAKPPEPIPWRVHDLVADGTLTIISGEAGCGKSWLAQAFCTGVARGRAVAGLPCVKGAALYIDAEMGPRMFVDQRLRPTGVRTAEFAYIDAMGLDVSKPDDLTWVRGEIDATGAKLVVIDSLRRLTPSKAENDSDDMAPAVSALAKLARDTRAAIVLIHHKGDGEKFFRGSTAIKDQCDAMFALLRDPDDEHAPRRLRCQGKGKMRYAPEPQDVYLEISPDAGGVTGSDPPDNEGPVIPARQAVAAAIRAAMPAKTKTEVAEKVGRGLNDNSFRAAWGDLQEAGEIAKISGHWELCSHRLPLGNPMTTYSGFGSTPSPDHNPGLRLVDGAETNPEGAA